MIKIFTLLPILLLTVSATAQVRLNEAVNSNSLLGDDDGDTPDWFELYNPGPARDISGWTVTDDADEPTKWRFENLTIEADGYLLFWASDKDRQYDPAVGAGHTNFKLSSAGETLYLLDAAGRLVDQLRVAGVAPNTSIGIPLGGGAAAIFETTTPGGPNLDSGFIGRVEARVEFSRAGGRVEPLQLRLAGAPRGRCNQVYH